MKYVEENEILLQDNDIILVKSSQDSLEPSFTIDELFGVLKQQPNRMTFRIPFYLMIYNLSNQDRIDKRIVKKNKQLQRKVNKRFVIKMKFLKGQKN
jgi:hypothetical protein